MGELEKSRDVRVLHVAGLCSTAARAPAQICFVFAISGWMRCGGDRGEEGPMKRTEMGEGTGERVKIVVLSSAAAHTLG